MMSILTGLILVVVLGAIVQKSDALMDAFSDFTGENSEESDAVSDGAEPVDQTASATQPDTDKMSESQAETSAPAVTAPASYVAGYRASFDEVTIEAGGTYAIDVLGNDVGVQPETYGKLVLLSSTTSCGIVRLIEGRVGYFADEQCVGVHHVFYCIEGAGADQCEEGVLNITVVSPASATLDPARFLNDVSPNTNGLHLPDRAPKIDISVTAPVVSDRPAPSPAVRSPLISGTKQPRLPATDSLQRDAGLRPAAPSRGGLFADQIADDAAPPEVDGVVRQPAEVALLDARTDADPLASTKRNSPAGQGVMLSPFPLVKPTHIDHAAPEAPRIAGAGVLQSPTAADAEAPAGSVAAKRVHIRDVGKAELLVRRADTAQPPDSVRFASALAAPDVSGDAPEIATASVSDGRGADAGPLERTDYVSVASLTPVESGAAVSVNPTSRLPDAQAPEAFNVADPSTRRDGVNAGTGDGASTSFVLRDRTSATGKSDRDAHLARSPENLLGGQIATRAIAGDPENGGGSVTDERTKAAVSGGGETADQSELTAGRGDFILRDKPAKAIPREALFVDPNVASSETPTIAPVETAALNMDEPTGLATKGDDADGAQGTEVAAIDPNSSDSSIGAETRTPAIRADCDVDLTAVGSRGALIGVEALSACRAGQVMRFVHHGVEFATRFDAEGRAELLLPALDRDAVVLARTEDEREAYVRVSVPGMGRVSRLALIWRDPLDINLHAFEYGAAFGAEGHVWEGVAVDVANYKRGRAGLLQAFRPIDGYGDNIEIYSFAPGRRSTAGAVEFAIEFASRGATPAAPYCDGGAMASPRYTVLQFKNGKLDAPTEGVIDAAACGVRLTEALRYRRGLVNNVVVSR